MAQYRLVTASAVLVVLCALTLVRSAVFETEVTLYTDIVARSPNKARPHNNLGDALKKSGRIAEAVHHLERALELQPDYPDALNNLGTIYGGSGRRQEAIQFFSQAIMLSPGHLQARFNLAINYYEQGMLSEAEQQYGVIIQSAPYSKEAVFARKMLALMQKSSGP